MILDTKNNLGLYKNIHPKFRVACDFIENTNLKILTPKRYDIDNDNVYAIVSTTTGRGRENAKLEAHRKYIDLQYVIDGTDEIGWCDINKCKYKETEYDLEKDVILYKDTPSVWVKLEHKTCALFFPSDAHAPLAGVGEMKRLVIKIKV